MQVYLERVLFDLYKDEDWYKVTSREAMLETLGSVTDTLMIVLVGIVAISLVVGGIGIIAIIGKIGLVPAVYSGEWSCISFFVSVGIGLLFGLFPAYKAASMNPIEALRSN